MASIDVLQSLNGLSYKDILEFIGQPGNPQADRFKAIIDSLVGTIGKAFAIRLQAVVSHFGLPDTVSIGAVLTLAEEVSEMVDPYQYPESDFKSGSHVKVLDTVYTFMDEYDLDDETDLYASESVENALDKLSVTEQKYFDVNSFNAVTSEKYKNDFRDVTAVVNTIGGKFYLVKNNIQCNKKI
jgi:hypothetical protein